MILGVTGSRWHPSEDARIRIMEFLSANVDDIESLHHGVCVGCDEYVATLARDLGIVTHGHPPTNQEFMSSFVSVYTEPPKSYLARNRDIVDVSDFLLAIPREDSKGTRYTMTYARKRGVPMEVINASLTIDRTVPQSVLGEP